VNGDAIRLVYAPHGESSGAITFRLDDIASVGGRPILDAFLMLLSANRFFGVAEGRALPALLAESRTRQANVTNELADQVFEALQILLRGFESAAERDGRALLDDALAREHDHLYKGLLTVLLRLVFVLYAEDRGLLPTDKAFYSKHLSLLALFDELQTDHGAYPDSMSRRFGAWGRLIALFRAIYLGFSQGELEMPARRGSLFNPHEYPFLEGWGPAGSAPITQAEDRAGVKLPTIDDETVFSVLERLLVFEGQRLSYRALDVEQIGSVYEALMGYHVLRVSAEAVCTKPDRIWVTAEEVLEVPAARRAKWLKETLGLSSAQSEKLKTELGQATGKNAKELALEALARFAAGGKKADPALSKARAQQLVLQPGTERRRTSSHYTPRSLSEPIVRRTLEPLLAVMGDAPASERILNLKVCDPAMGSGAFLVEACRFLADHLLAAWTREGKIESIAGAHGDPLLHARRVVAQRCLYGVDKNDAAVELAKLSLWLVTLAKNLPFTFLDHSLRHGDSLVGLDFDQIRAFHWKRPAEDDQKQLELFGREIAVALDEAIGLRQTIGELGDTPLDDKEKARLFWDAQDSLSKVRLIADLVVGAFFAHEKDKDREAERVRRENLVRAWLLSGDSPSEELLEMQREIRERIPVFHWMVEYPEVFYAERPDPLDEDQVNRAAFMDAFVGNPPFAGKNRISETNGVQYVPWLLITHEPAHGNADLSAHFFRRTRTLLGKHGTIGLLATNTIAQGDTRATGLQVLLANGCSIYEASSNVRWGGDADVFVSVVHLALGNVGSVVGTKRLNGIATPTINSQLSDHAERDDPHRLLSNSEMSFQGSVVLGTGFSLDLAERASLESKDSRNAQRISPYLGGQELNTSPQQKFERYVINFGDLTLEEAGQWPDLIGIVREKVKPDRDNNNRDNYRISWWLFGEARPGLYRALSPLKRCLVISRHTKHLCFAFEPADWIFSEATQVFPLDRTSSMAVLQSRTHELWARMLSSEFGSSSIGAVLRYSSSTCFETFPFPRRDPRTVIPSLEDIGQRLYDLRAKYMVDENVGLTITYNRLKDPTWDDPRILELRQLHEEMDRKVLGAYAEGDPEGRWLAVEVPPFCPLNDEDKKKLERFEDAVIDRLFVLNAKRAEEEKLLGLGTAKSNKQAAKGKAKAAAGDKKPRARKKKAEGQLGLLGNDDEG
jgi:hypothetical protein